MDTTDLSALPVFDRLRKAIADLDDDDDTLGDKYYLRREVCDAARQLVAVVDANRASEERREPEP
jgi:hypothetical protein